MPVVVPDLGHGANITFQSGIMALLLDVSWSGVNRAAVDTTHLGTSGGKTFIPGDNYDPGELSVELQFNSGEDWDTAIAAAAETVTVTFPDTSTWAATGFLTDLEITDITNEGVMKASATLKLSGDITITAAA